MQAAAISAHFTMRYSMRCVCNSVAYELVTCMQSRAACTSILRLCASQTPCHDACFLQQSADVSRCPICAVTHALLQEVCLQLSSLQASHMHAVQGCLRQAYCGSVQAKHIVRMLILVAVCRCEPLPYQRSFPMRYSMRCVCNSVAHKLVTRLQSRAERSSRFSEACPYTRASHLCFFQSVVLNALLLACMPCSRSDLSGRNE